MNSEEKPKANIPKAFLVYFGTAWLFIEAFNFVVQWYNLESSYLDIIIILVLFGLPSVLIHEWFNQQFTRKALMLHALNITLAITVVSFNQAFPDKINPTKLRLLEFKKNQKKLAQTINSIAILPLENMTNDTSQIYLVNGIHDEIISQMGIISGIRVVSRTSAMNYKDTQKRLNEIAGDLHVDAIIEGSVLPTEPDKIKVQLRLIGNMPDEIQLWSKSYELEKRKVLNLYATIAKNIATEINLALSPDEKEQLEETRTVDPKCYELYLRGKVNLAFLTLTSIENAEQYFLKSIEIDPDFGPSYAGLAGIWVARKQLYSETYPHNLTNPKIDAYIKKSFELDSMDAEVWRWYASKLAYDFDWQGCNQAMEKCLELNPSFAEAHAFYAHFLMMQNKWEEAWRQIIKAKELDPLNPLVKFFQDVMYIHSGNWDELNMKPPYMAPLMQFSMYADLGKSDSSILALKLTLEARGFDELSNNLAALYEETNDYKTSLNMVGDSLVSLGDSSSIQGPGLLLIYLYADNVEKSLSQLEKMYIVRDPDLPYFAIKGPHKKEWFMNHPRYIAIMKHINLME
ncbi:hypothetical protein [Marinoscillum sp. MHG1-6]|uniref:tetratricopeptide repeat protein n=1 Tax=Marinoscillum sp. MHG1-6 TaxID=2959627 RepID=UPI002157E072|nr:hypothetical protein [Marinoscillum sp. MHG1-6]